ncbi:Neurochondrin-domain-containing protein [Chaetomium sp. MPI-SDFR-AT-0129]|nr:Neurochondrin-domain-containing protein [Chaetomium sp. MPI-SDFR-AT-0129]
MNQTTPPTEPQTQTEDDTTLKIRTLLRAKDDTSRFVGLALLKSLLDNTPDLRSNHETLISLWEAIPPKFLARLIKTGSTTSTRTEPSRTESSRKGANDMLDLAVSVLHTFASLLSGEARQSAKFVERIPQLVACLLHSSDETTKLALETLVSLVSQPEGARAFTAVEDLSPLTEIASSQPLALDVLLYAWLNAMAVVTNKDSLRSKMDSTIGSLVVSFKGTDAVTLLSFLGNLLPKLEAEILPSNPKWLPALARFIHNLVASRPTAAGREAFTNLSAALLEVYPFHAPALLFSNQDTTTTKSSSNPSSYLLINLLQVDLRATLPTLLSQLNNPTTYPPTAHRLTSAFNITSHFTGYLLRSLESSSDTTTTLSLPPDLLLTLRKSLSETLSLTAEFLRDRWDASVAGAMGLHPDARAPPPPASTASTNNVNVPSGRGVLAWDSITTNVASDPLVLAAVRCLAIWVREDDGEVLRREVSGLADMFVELYRGSCNTPNNNNNNNNDDDDDKNGADASPGLDFRRAILVALEGITDNPKGREAVLEHGGWEVLAADLLDIFTRSSSKPAPSASAAASASESTAEEDSARGVEIVRVLLQIAEAEQPGPREAWMDLVTRVAAWDVPDGNTEKPSIVEECQVAVLQLVTTLLANAHAGMRRRYVHSMSAMVGIARQLLEGGRVEGDRGLEEALRDVVDTLEGIR